MGGKTPSAQQWMYRNDYTEKEIEDKAKRAGHNIRTATTEKRYTERKMPRRNPSFYPSVFLCC